MYTSKAKLIYIMWFYDKRCQFWRTNEPSIRFSVNWGGIVKEENGSLKLDAGAGLNSYGPPFTPQTWNVVKEGDPGEINVIYIGKLIWKK